MPRIPRKTQKIFAGSASNNGVFGSAADNTKVLSNDIDVIQSKAAYAAGWIDAVLGVKKFPALEEMQALTYMTTTQLAYLFQEGVPEYSATTTYYESSIVKLPGTYEIYGSLIDDNIGNPVTDTDSWEFLQDLGESYQQATITELGIARLATIADIRAGLNQQIVTPDLLAAYGFQTGDWKGTTRSNVQAGWIWAAGTIGNASSNATNRANADTQELFNLYWNDAAYNYTGTNATGAALQVYTSAGAAVAKGASAAADWAANRQIAVVDFRDRVAAGRGNMVGNAGLLTGQPGGVSGNTLGAKGGDESHSLTADENGPHTHGQWFEINGNPTNANRQNARGDTDGQVYDEDGVAPSGDGSPHNNVQPTVITNIIIKL